LFLAVSGMSFKVSEHQKLYLFYLIEIKKKRINKIRVRGKLNRAPNRKPLVMSFEVPREQSVIDLC